MTKPYLPAWATAQEAAEWLQAETGQPWPLPRLIESGAMPHVWLTPAADDQQNSEVFDVVFDGRHEGFMAPVLFAGDTHRISGDRTGTLSMTRAKTGPIVRFTPPLAFDLGSLRFDASQVQRLAATPAAPVAVAATTSKGIGPTVTTDDLCDGFDGLKWSSLQWRAKINKGPPAWLTNCRADPGKGGATPRQATWFPLNVALALVKGEPRGEPVTVQDVDRAFKTRPELKPCARAWAEYRDDHPELG